MEEDGQEKLCVKGSVAFIGTSIVVDVQSVYILYVYPVTYCMLLKIKKMLILKDRCCSRQFSLFFAVTSGLYHIIFLFKVSVVKTGVFV